MLVADDDPFNVMSLQAMLKENYGIESVSVSNGAEALEFVKV